MLKSKATAEARRPRSLQRREGAQNRKFSWLSSDFGRTPGILCCWSHHILANQDRTHHGVYGYDMGGVFQSRIDNDLRNGMTYRNADVHLPHN